jgi:hypothetical protein
VSVVFCVVDVVFWTSLFEVRKKCQVLEIYF